MRWWIESWRADRYVAVVVELCELPGHRRAVDWLRAWEEPLRRRESGHGT